MLDISGTSLICFVVCEMFDDFGGCIWCSESLVVFKWLYLLWLFE